MIKKPIGKYTTVLHGQEVTVTVYEPATEEDMNKPTGVPTHEDLDVDTEDEDEPDLYDELTNERGLWRSLTEEDYSEED